MKREPQSILEKAYIILATVSNDGGSGYGYSDGIIDFLKEIKDEDYLILKEKMDNLVTLLNSLSKEELVEFADRDFEDDVWNII